MGGLRHLWLSGNPVTGIQKYRDQVVLLTNALVELDGKDINEQERRYLVNLLNRKNVQATVYNDMKKKKQNFLVDGKTYAIHEQKN
jgi:hypothetical protein